MDKRNATSSWSGYLHQGKVGIFLMLKNINELITSTEEFSRNDLIQWKIEYESAEDIDIKNGDIVDSRHQVKAYKDAKYPNDYTDVLSILEYKLDDNGNKVLKNKGFRICNFDDNAKSLEIEVEEDSRYLHTVTETLGFGLTEIEFKTKYSRAKYIENPNNIRLYEYPSRKKYCSLSNDNDDLKKYCMEEIKKILKFEKHVFKDDEDKLERILGNITWHLDMEIRKKHIKGEGTYPELKFLDMYDLILDTKPYTKSNIESIREIFVKSWVIFLQELDDCDIKYDNVQETKIENIIKEIYLWDNDKFIQFLNNIHPDENQIGNIDTNDDFAKLCKIESLKDVFYECLLEVKDEEFILEDIGYARDGGYVLTAINRKPAKVKSIIKSIIENPHITNYIFDKKYLINGQIDDIAFNDILYNTMPENNINCNWGSLATEKDKFYSTQMKFISVENVKDKLNKR